VIISLGTGTYSVIAGVIAGDITGRRSSITLGQVDRALLDGVTLLRALPPAGVVVKALEILSEAARVNDRKLHREKETDKRHTVLWHAS
jgi:hypothetical protein